MVKKVHILKDNFSSELFAIGLVSSDSVFQVMLHLNSFFDISLKLTQPLKPEASDVSFATALHDEEDELKIYLFKNKSEGHVLFKNQSSLDFIIVVTGNTAGPVNEKLIQNARLVTNVSLVMPVEIGKLKNLKNYLR